MDQTNRRDFPRPAAFVEWFRHHVAETPALELEDEAETHGTHYFEVKLKDTEERYTIGLRQAVMCIKAWYAIEAVFYKALHGHSPTE